MNEKKLTEKREFRRRTTGGVYHRLASIATKQATTASQVSYEDVAWLGSEAAEAWCARTRRAAAALGLGRGWSVWRLVGPRESCGAHAEYLGFLQLGWALG
ncbi:hypothetical protein ES288_D11G124500v1 [Gossypium darwinii]|uniref:Uncharacterized protein n=1 Tax=Gossypium darwinii TaxID=34276 RepID=A0A5D2AK89_GOSDA|nr:hypothetical protein ES288_D11G124500v1 [Gossypium darwinii]